MYRMRVIAGDLKFPEGPVAFADGSVALVESRGQTLTLVTPDGNKSTLARIAGGPNGAALGPDGRIYVCNNGGMGWHLVQGQWLARPPLASEYRGGSIQRIDPATGEVETLFTRCGDNALRAPNDLVFDRQGGLWFTDFGKFRSRDLDFGGVYYVTPDMKHIFECAYPMLQANGIALSSDERTLYTAETYTARLWAFKLGGAGQIVPVSSALRGEKGRCLAGLGGYRMFDSMALEACGNICLATMLTGEITVISPTGSVVETVDVGDPGVSNIAFGGADMRTAFVTLGRSGTLVAIDWPRPGLPLNFGRIPINLANRGKHSPVEGYGVA